MTDEASLENEVVGSTGPYVVTDCLRSGYDLGYSLIGSFRNASQQVRESMCLCGFRVDGKPNLTYCLNQLALCSTCIGNDTHDDRHMHDTRCRR